MIVFGLIIIQSSKVDAANISTQFASGDAVSGAASDAWALDNTNKGVATMDLTFNGAGNRDLTITPDGAAAGSPNDYGFLRNITVANDNGTTTMTLADSTADGAAHTLRIYGNVSGDVATDANDLRIVILTTSSLYLLF